MKNTTTWALPYPEPGDHTRTWEHWQSLAEKVDTQLTVIYKPPFVQVEQSVAQSLPDSTITPITFDVENFDPNNMHAPANPSRLVAPKAGYYRLTGALSFTGNATGRRGASWSVNGAIVGQSLALPTNGTNTLTTPAPDQIAFLNAGEYAELRAYQTSGAALLTVVAANSRSYAAAQFLSA